MCGRFYIAEEDKAEELQRIIDQLNRKYNGVAGIKTQGEIRPTDIVATIANSPSMQQGVFAMRWGYTMPDGKPMFNARSETAATKPLFADGMKQRRCLIPATCYFEWEKRDGKKIKHAIATQGSSMIYLAGLYRREGNQAVCTILTRDAAECIAHIHHRMPVILPVEAIPDWLNPRYDARDVLRVAQSNMNFIPV
nr:SOS response-associated peptidase [Clostridia bacterium]